MDFETTVNRWQRATPGIKVPENDEDLDRLIALSDFIIDKMANDDDPGLETLLLVVGNLIEEYESQAPYQAGSDAVDILKMLMENHGLKQQDLTEIGSQGVVSEILSRKRPLNLRQVKALAERFGCSKAIFID